MLFRSAFREEPFVNHWLRVSSTKRTRVGLVVGEAIRGPHEDIDALRELVHERVQALVHEARALLR